MHATSAQLEQAEPWRADPELTLEAMDAKRAEIWTLLLVHTGACSVLHIFNGGRCSRTFTGREETLRELAAQYAPADLHEGGAAEERLRAFSAGGGRAS